MGQDKSDDLVLKIHNDLRDLCADLKVVVQNIESAFPRDENNNVDYLGHRIYHKTQAENAKELKKSRQAITRGVVVWVTIGIISILGSTIVENYVYPIIKAIKAAQ